MIFYLKNCISVLFIFSIASCSIRPNSKGGGKHLNEKYVMNFYRGNNELLYFVKPITFKSDHMEFIVDFTFVKRGDSILDSVTLNYSLILNVKNTPSEVQSIRLSTTKIEVGELLLNEAKRSKHVVRYTTKIPKQLFKTLTDNTIINCTLKDKEYSFYPKSSFGKKSLSKIAHF